MTGHMDPIDIVLIEQLYARYGYVMDDRAWDRLGDVFTEDCVFDATAFGMAIARVLFSMALGTYPKGRAFSGRYDDLLVSTAAGWRIQRRVARPQPAPD